MAVGVVKASQGVREGVRNRGVCPGVIDLGNHAKRVKLPSFGKPTNRPTLKKHSLSTNGSPDL
jgi:hypothetical protein